MCTPAAPILGATPAGVVGKKALKSMQPSIPAPPPPPQEGKEPDTMAERRRRRGAAATGGGSILTSPSGIANNALNTGGNTILGG